jgi:hypothetical protein
MALMTNLERRMAAEALAQLLAGEGNFTEAQWQAAHSALDKLRRPDPARKLRECLNVAYMGFSRDDEGPVWSDTLLHTARRILKATE